MSEIETLLNLPDEILCVEIIHRITDIEDIRALMDTSKRFKELTKSCVKNLTNRNHEIFGNNC